MTDLIWVISSSVLILAVIAIRAIFGKRMSAGFRYALWALVLLRLLIPGTVFSSPVSVESAVSSAPVVGDMEKVRGVSSVSMSDGVVTGRVSYPRPASQTINISPAVTAAPVTDPAAPPAQPEAHQVIIAENATEEQFESIKRTVEARTVLNSVWLSGMGVMAAWFVFTHVRMYLTLRKCRVRIAIEAPCPVYFVEDISSSCLFINSIYVSKETAENEDELKNVLAHELAHRRHGDGLTVFLRGIALILHWYNPLVWAAALLSRRDGEVFADAGAIKALGEDERENYGLTLIGLSTKLKKRVGLCTAATTMTGGKRELKERITHMAKDKKTKLIIAAAVTALALAAVAFCFLGCKSGNPPANDDPDAAKITEAPTEAPTESPTKAPTEAPTEAPTQEPADIVYTRNYEILAAIPAQVYPSWTGCDWQDGIASIVPDPDAESQGSGQESQFLCGPNSFCFDDKDNVCILDTYAKRVLVVSLLSNKVVKTVDFPQAGFLTEVAAGGGMIYVLDESRSEVAASDGVTIRTYPLSRDVSLADMYLIGGSLMVRLDSSRTVVLDGEGFKNCAPLLPVSEAHGSFMVTGEWFDWMIPNDGMGIHLIGSDEDGRLYAECSGELFDRDGNSLGDLNARAYDTSGRLLYAALIDDEAGRVSPPLHICKLDDEYRICQLYCSESAVEIRRFVFSSDSDWTFCSEDESNYYAYMQAAADLLANGSLTPVYTCDAYFRLDDDAFRAFAKRSELHRITDDGQYKYSFEYSEPIAEYPREVGEKALNRLYADIAESSFVGPYTEAEGFVGDDWFVLKTMDDTMQDIQFSVIFHREGNEWHEFGDNNSQQDRPLFGACIVDENVGFLSYFTKFYDQPDGSYRKIWLYRTDDGGRNWVDMGLEIPEEYGNCYPGYAASPVFDGDHGVMQVCAFGLGSSGEETQYKGLWYETFDGGLTWTLREGDRSGQIDFPSDEWLTEESWKLAQEAGRIHGLEFHKENIQINKRTIPSDVPFGEVSISFNEDDYRLWFRYVMDGEGNWPELTMDSARLDLEWDVEVDDEKFMSDLAELEWPSVTVSEKDLKKAGYEFADAEEAKDCAARYCGGLVERMFTECSKDNYMRCYEAVNVELERNDLDPDYQTHLARLAVRPVNERLFLSGFGDILERLYGGDEYPECRGWFTLYYGINAVDNGDGTYTVNVNFGA